VSQPAKPGMSVSLDMDNLWSYMKTHGDKGWQEYPTYLDPLVDVVLDRLRKHNMTITFFVVGQDAALEKNAAAFRALGSEAHEIGSHSFKHEPWLHLYTPAELEEELASAESHIERATGKRPIGFRGPGFSYSRETLDFLKRRGYLYDASTFPTFIGALARAYYFWKSEGLTKEQKEKRKGLFGKFSDGFQPLRPYRWGGSDGLLEIPVTTMPIFRTPMHLSYVIYLSRFSKVAAETYFRTALRLARLRGIQPSLLLHPLDFLGKDKVPQLSFFPGMDIDTAEKLEFFDLMVECIKREFEPITMEQHARAELAKTGLKRRILPPASAQSAPVAVPA
jgi:hypothetical protein